MTANHVYNGVSIEVVRDYDEMSRRAGEIILDRIRSRTSLSVLLPTGTTAIGVYKILRESDRSLFTGVRFLNMDEYCHENGVLVPENNPASYRLFMKKNLFGFIGDVTSYFPTPENAKTEGTYDSFIARMEGIDLCLNSMGEDGHTFGFNFPGTSFESQTRIVKVHSETKGVNERLTGLETPDYALTTGIKTGMGAREVLFLVSGERKAKKLREVVYGPINEDVPASVLRRHSNCIWIVDEEAARML